VPMDVAQKVALLDQVRGVLFARSHNGGTFLAPVSTLAIHHGLGARNVSADTGVLLDTLLSLHDVQDLPRGHWLPVSTRCVWSGKCALVVSGAPTEFLRRDYGLNIGGRGLGRLVLNTSTSALPNEPLLHWLGVPDSSTQWCENLICMADFGDAFGWEDLSVYDHWNKRNASRWVSTTVARLPDGPVFARSIQRHSATSHYLLLVRNGAIRGVHEFPRRFDSRRFALAMLARADNAFSFSLTESDADTYVLNCPYLPSSEQRLLTALGTVEARDRGLSAEVPAAAVTAVCDTLVKLGMRDQGASDG
jgi:hypothetical protein